MKSTYVIVVIALAALSGCANFTSPARHHVLVQSSATWIDYDASRRGTLVQVSSDGHMVGCAEPAPDIGLSQINKIKVVTAASETAKNEGEAEFSNTAVPLAGRTQLVLALREALFRICESSINKKMTKEETKSLFETTIKSLAALADADQKTAEAKREEATQKNKESQFRIESQKFSPTK